MTLLDIILSRRPTYAVVTSCASCPSPLHLSVLLAQEECQRTIESNVSHLTEIPQLEYNENSHSRHDIDPATAVYYCLSTGNDRLRLPQRSDVRPGSPATKSRCRCWWPCSVTRKMPSLNKLKSFSSFFQHAAHIAGGVAHILHRLIVAQSRSQVKQNIVILCRDGRHSLSDEDIASIWG